MFVFQWKERTAKSRIHFFSRLLYVAYSFIALFLQLYHLRKYYQWSYVKQSYSSVEKVTPDLLWSFGATFAVFFLTLVTILP